MTTTQNNIYNPSFTNTYADLKSIVHDKDTEPINNYNSTEHFDNFGLNNSKGKPLDCSDKKIYYTKYYSFASLLTDFVKFWTGKIDTKDDLDNGCLSTTDAVIIKNKIDLITQINKLIIKLIILIVSFIYLFQFSTIFGDNIIPKLLFGITIPLLGPLYLTWVSILCVLHHFSWTKDTCLWWIGIFKNIFNTILLKAPLFTFFYYNYYIFGSKTILEIISIN